MIDDDQYVHPNIIGDIFSKRKPQTNKAWFGKTWYQHSICLKQKHNCTISERGLTPRLYFSILTMTKTYNLIL